MNTASYKDFLYSVEAEVAERKKQLEKQKVSTSKKPISENRHIESAKKAAKPSVFEQLKEIPGKADHLNKRFKLWANSRKNLGFYKRYLDRIESGLYSRYGSEASVFENHMIDDPVHILKGPAQEYIRDIVAEVNDLFTEVTEMAKTLENCITAERAISVINEYTKGYIKQNIKGKNIDNDKLSYKEKILNSTKFKIANILLRHGDREVYGYTVKNMVLKRYPPPNHLIVTLFVKNPEENPVKQSVTDIFSSAESFRILADSDKTDVFNVVNMTQSVVKKTVDGKIMNDIKLFKSNAIKNFKESKNPNKADDAKIIDSIWEGINISFKELLHKKSYFIACINVYYDMILRIDRLAILSMKSILDVENVYKDNKYKSGISTKRDTNLYDDDGNVIQTGADRNISKIEENRRRLKSNKNNSNLNTNIKEINDVRKKVNKLNR